MFTKLVSAFKNVFPGFEAEPLHFMGCWMWSLTAPGAPVPEWFRVAGSVAGAQSSIPAVPGMGGLSQPANPTDCNTFIRVLWVFFFIPFHKIWNAALFSSLWGGFGQPQLGGTFVFSGVRSKNSRVSWKSQWGSRDGVPSWDTSAGLLPDVTFSVFFFP